MYGINWEEADVAERKYQVGDRVRVVKGGYEKGGSFHCAKIGDVDEIIAIDVFGCPYEGRKYYYEPHEIEPAFAVGDRVKLRRHTATRSCGDRGVIDRFAHHGVSVRMNEAVFGGHFETIPIDALDWDRDYSKEAPAPDCAERKVEQDNEDKPQPKFKAGDVVTYPGISHYTMVIKGINTRLATDRIAYDYENGGWDYETSLVLAQPSTTCIVARIVDGLPSPSKAPNVHSSVEDATLEAERLARANPGTEFAVYQRVAGRVAEQHIEMKEVA